jgi:hypothetical protein
MFEHACCLAMFWSNPLQYYHTPLENHLLDTGVSVVGSNWMYMFITLNSMKQSALCRKLIVSQLVKELYLCKPNVHYLLQR